ncbi:MAG TPA: hypothetical protein VJW95_03460 [Dissulfurispiraceae bacterium]|nr:hypothetical protein [Dissulfurispiraceae bacterium]
MLNKLFRKGQAEEIYQSKSKDAADNIQVVEKKRDKTTLFFVLLLVLFAGAGVTGMKFMENSGGQKIQDSHRQFQGVKPYNQSPTPPAVPQEQQLPVQNAGGQKQRAVRAVYDSKERDVFKEFYLRHEVRGATLIKGPAMHLEQNLPDLTRLLHANSGVQALPLVHTLNTAPVNEQPREVKMFGITCLGEIGFPVDRCVAITSEGVLKKGDRLGSETVVAVNETSIVTSERTVELN